MTRENTILATLAVFVFAATFCFSDVTTNRVTTARLGSLHPRSGEVVTDVNFSGIAMTGDVARVEEKVDGMTNTFLRLSGGVLSGDLVVLPGVPYTVRLGKSPYTNFHGNGIWWGDEMGLAGACGIVCESLLGNIHFVSQGNIISLPSSHGILALQSEIPTTMAWSAITSKPSWIGDSKPSYTAYEVGAYSTGEVDTILEDYLPLDYFKNGQTIPMYWGDGTKLCDFGANWLGNLVSEVGGKLDKSGGTMTGNLVMGYNSLFQINGGGNAKFQFSWGSALDNLIISAFRETSGSYSIRFPTREGLLALTSDIPTSMAWDAITGKPTTISGYGITDALKSDFASLTNNAAFTSAVAAVSPPTDTSELEARGFVRIVADDEIYFVTITTTQTEE